MTWLNTQYATVRAVNAPKLETTTEQGVWYVARARDSGPLQKTALRIGPTPPVVALVKVSVARTLAEESLREGGGIDSVTRRHSREWRPCSVVILR